MAAGAFLPRELALALILAAAVEAGLFGLFVVAGVNKAKVAARDTAVPEEIPIAVKPVMDDLPLLKLGSKKVKAKLPDMWTKQAPVQRFEETSAPSEKAQKTVQAIPTSPVATKDAEAPPPDAALAKVVDQRLLDAGPPKAEPNLPTEGATDGVKTGTETDPLKARALDLYKAKILSWFQVRFRPPTELACDVLHSLNASAQITVGPDRTITGYTLTGPTNNDVFDSKVRATLEAMVGQQLPPPPPLYPDLSPGTLLHPILSGKAAQCE